MAPVPLRRLTRFEYNNTVRDLLGDDTRPADAFPPEEQSNTFDNDSGALRVSRLLAEGYAATAQKLATGAARNLSSLMGCSPKAPSEEEKCAKHAIDTFGQRVMRRPLESDEAARFFGIFRAARAVDTFETASATLIEAFLVAPQFLYRVDAAAAAGPWQLASRLSYLLWGSMPDDELFEAARTGKLAKRAQVLGQARRLLADPRARPMVRHFHRQWLGIGVADALTKDPKTFPAWTTETGALMREETESFVESAVFDGPGDVRTMLTAPYSMMNGKLATFHGLKDGPTADRFERVALDPARASGVLTQPSLMAVFATSRRTHPIQRGLFVRKQLLCAPPPNAPDNVASLDENAGNANASERERLAAHRDAPACAGCHRLFDPIGFGFENYDAVGKWRAMEHHEPVDASGEVVGTDVPGNFVGVNELAQRLTQSQQVSACLASNWFRFAAGRPLVEDDECALRELNQELSSSGKGVRDLLLALTQTDAFLGPEVSP